MRHVRTALGFSLVLLGAACSDAATLAPVDAGDGRKRDASSCISDSECSDGLFCNGAELCLPSDESADAFGCIAARRMPECDDGIACTTDSCSDDLNRCEFRAPDADGDGHADVACKDADGEALGEDCDDDDSLRFPGNIEVCDFEGHDEDCDASTFGVRDRDGDGEPDALCCNRVGDEETCGSDCDDLTIARRSGQAEFCDEVDNDCDDEIDEETRDVPWFQDADADNFGAVGAKQKLSCIPIPGRSLLATDCDDSDSARHAAQLEICDFIDNNCNGVIDEPAYCDQGGGVIIPDGGIAGTGAAGTGSNAGSGGNAGTGQAGTGQAGTGQAGTGQAGTGQAGTGQAGTGQAGTGVVIDTPNCAGPLFGDYMLRKDGYLLLQDTGVQRVIADDQAAPLDDVVQAQQGLHHGCALREDSSVWCWSTEQTSGNSSGQLGGGTVGGSTTLYRASQVLVSAGVPLNGIVSVATQGNNYNSDSSCAVGQNGALWCWGRLTELTNNGAALDSGYAVKVKANASTDLTGVLQVALTYTHACVLRAGTGANEVWCWGQNSVGQLGTGDTTQRQYPTKILGLTDPSAVALAYQDSCALDGDQVKCWGWNMQGASGINETTSPVFNPTFVKTMSGAILGDITAIHAGTNDVCALGEDEKLWCWGYYAARYAAPYQVSAADVTDVVAIGNSPYDRRFLTSDGNYHLGTTARAPNCNDLE